MPEAVVVAAGRSPIGRAVKGSLVNVRADDLGAHIVIKVLETLPELDRSEIEDLICGCGLPGGEQGFNLGRAVSILANLDVPGTTITRYCSSSLQSTRMAAHAIKAGEGDAFLSVGIECVSRFINGMSDNPQNENELLKPGNTHGYPDIYIAMGQTAENVARREEISRDEQDKFALRSQQRAVAAQDSGFFDREIIPVPLGDGAGEMTKDDGPRRETSLEKLSSLAPVFREEGTVTAGNSCPLNDGAAAVLVMSDEKARGLGLEPMARIVASTVAAIRPEIMGLGPIPAIRALLEQTGMGIDDVDIVEINEAFAAQVIPAARGIGIEPWDERFNPHGGAIALGHPFGMTGARILCTLLNDLRTLDKTIGLETMCVGGGMGMAMVVERLN
ncbi:MAG: acetyl-CoA C-acyltransferase [Candidatus Aeolococcus gillhamiae]|uniref:Acetyl-CoA C-acyltransferase n=1 Tax=Candidatus Aeolococcus gillhamiae TaxID=3127015 RepID=A0A2W5ZDP0_9BACT|nr:MAG: acetyl-CoA C-acyltransferase [Candidatus Dormibacter sp. RRmetagenome_bin12]